MGQIDEAIKDHKEECGREMPRKFVPWSWVVSLFVGLFTTVVGAAVSGALYVSSVRSETEQNTKTLDRHERAIEAIAEIRGDIKAIRMMVSEKK